MSVKYIKHRPILKTVICLFVCAVIIYLAFTSSALDIATDYVELAAKTSVMMTLPEGGEEKIFDRISLFAQKPTQSANTGVSANGDGPNNILSETPDNTFSESSSSSSDSQTQSAEAQSSDASAASDAPPEEYGTVTERLYTSSSANLKWNNIYVSRKIDVDIDISTEIAQKPDIKILKNGKPQVLIMHTHATESYLAEDNGTFKIGGASRSTDEAQNMIAVGAEIAAKINAAGIVTLQDKTLHDYPSYSGAYERSEATVKKYLEQYPSIEVVLDIHRDAISASDTKKIKPTAVINGKKAAQLMIISGCEYGSVTDYPDWRENLRFGLRVQQAMETLYPGLARPLMFDDRKYNQQLTHGSILIEMGSDSNTLEEAKYSGQLLGDALVSVLEQLIPT